MPCYYPLAAWRSHTKNPETGKYGIQFTPPKHKVKEPEPINLPCGKCIGCLADQSMMWSVRAYHESTEHVKNCFLTLTYNDENLPPDHKISKEDLQKFFKRLRHKYKFRYLACGEYGETTRRPHYHALIFGEDFKQFDYQLTIDDKNYINTQVRDIWGQGNILINPMELGSIMYTCGYVHKKLGDDDCFRLASRRPAIGKNWFEKYWPELSRDGYCVIEGRKFNIPKRYIEWKEDEFEEVKKLRKEVMKEQKMREGALTSRSKEKNKRGKLNSRNKGTI